MSVVRIRGFLLRFGKNHKRRQRVDIWQMFIHAAARIGKIQNDFTGNSQVFNRKLTGIDML